MTPLRSPTPSVGTSVRRWPLTRVGWSVVFLGVVAYITGWWFGWIELMVLAAASGLAIVVAGPFVVGRQALAVERRLTPSEVTVGDEATLHLTVTNAGRTSIRGTNTIIEERIAGHAVAIDLLGLAPGESREITRRLPTDQRGVIPVGPLVVAKADPLGLLRRDVRQVGVRELWVVPRTRSVGPVHTGLAKDLEGPSSETSPAGDVSFHALRSYQFGDDHRHIHWLSTARTGELMVRHYVDNRLPHLGIVLDTRRSTYNFAAPDAPDSDLTPSATAELGMPDSGIAGGRVVDARPTDAFAPDFETAIEVVASVVVSNITARIPVTWSIGGRPRRAVTADTTLRDLSRLEAGGDTTRTLGTAVGDLVRHAPDISAVLVVTSAIPSSDLLAVTARIERAGAIPIVVRSRIAETERPLPVPGVTTIDVTCLEEFVIGWEGAMRS